MRTVLYTADFEPITVIDVPMEFIEYGRRTGCFRVAVPVDPRAFMAVDDPLNLPMHVVTIRVQCLMWFGQMRYVLITDDEVLALLLTPSWLPGQQGTINAYERNIKALLNRMFRDGPG